MELWFWIILGIIGLISIIIVLSVIIHNRNHIKNIKINNKIKPNSNIKDSVLMAEAHATALDYTLKNRSAAEQIIHANDPDDEDEGLPEGATRFKLDNNEFDEEEEQRKFRKALKQSQKASSAKDDDTEYVGYTPYKSSFNFVKIIVPLISVGVFIFIGLTLYNTIQPTLQTMNTSGSLNGMDMTAVNNMMSWFPWLIAFPIMLYIFLKVLSPIGRGL
jgi:hypothetical protein